MIAAVIRAATTDEAGEVAELFLAARHAMENIVPMVHGDEETRQWMRSVVFRETSVMVGLMDGRIAAMISMRPGWIEHLYVHPRYQGRGLGTALLHTAQHDAQAAAGLQLWAFQSNLRARRFYARHGFVEVLFTDGRDNEEKAPDVKLAWSP